MKNIYRLILILLFSVFIHKYSFAQPPLYGGFDNQLTTMQDGYAGWNFTSNIQNNITFNNFLNKSQKSLSAGLVVYHIINTNISDGDNLEDLDFLLNNDTLFTLTDNGITNNSDQINYNYDIPFPFPSSQFKLTGSGSINIGVKNVRAWVDPDKFNVTTRFNPTSETSKIWYDIKIRIPEDMLYESSYSYGPGELSFEDDGGDTHYASASQWPSGITQTMTGWGDIELAQTLTATPGCGQVTLSWNIQNTNSVDVESMWARIYQDGIHIGQKQCIQGNNTFDVILNSDVTSHDYEVKVGYAEDSGNNYANYIWKRAKSTNSASAAAIPPLPAPFGFEATDNRCDGKIRLSWSWNQAAPASYDIVVLNGSNPIDTLSANGSSNSYIYSAPVKNVNYTFKIYALGTQCSGWGYPSSDEGIALDKPNAPSNLTLNQLPGTAHMQLNWTDNSSLPSNEDNFRFIRSSASSNVEYTIPSDNTTYIDEFGSVCIPYTYTIRAENTCGVSNGTYVSAQLQPQALDSTFNGYKLNASKGYFSNKVELSWNLRNANQLTDVLLLRKPIASTDADFVELTLLDPAIKFYIDNIADANVIYEYAVVGRSNCGTTIFYTDTIRSAGFRYPYGTITGQVNYTGGIAVPGVKIFAESTGGTTPGKSIHINDTNSYLEVPNNALFSTSSFTVEMWFKPESYASNFKLLDYNDLSIEMNNGNFELKKGSYTISTPASAYTLGNYHQITASFRADTLHFYLNGAEKGTPIYISSLTALGSSNLKIGEGFVGNIDEFRFWNIGKDSLTISQDYLRELSGAEAGLVCYLKFIEGAGNFAYDFSHAGNVYHKNDATLVGNFSWSNVIPTPNQLSYVSYTNLQGNYSLLLPYSGVGESFILTPSFGVHQFNPGTQTLYVGENAIVYNNINFTDISSFTVEGYLYYDNTTCGVEGANLYVDGTVVFAAGSPVVTNAQGYFQIQVPIGQHVVTVGKNKHTMSVGRFPVAAGTTYNFQDDFAYIQFRDSTLVTVTGRIAGGKREEGKVLGFGKSKNNIGQGTVYFASTNGCHSDTAMTDAQTGEYVIKLPPLQYNYQAEVNNPASVIPSWGPTNINLSQIPNTTTVFDTIDPLTNTIDSFTYHQILNFIYVEPEPQIKVTHNDRVTPFIGDTSIMYITINNDTIERNLQTNPFDWPVFSIFDKDDDFSYQCLISIFETYWNPDNSTIDTVPVNYGNLYVNNDLASVTDTFNLDMSEMSVDTLKYIHYSFKPGEPNFNSNQSVPELGYVNQFVIRLQKPNNQSVFWTPDVYAGPNTNFKNNYDKFFRGYLMGTRSNGNQFITSGPQIPEYVLRDPPGSNSSATREVGSTKTEEMNWNWSLGGTVASEDKLMVGTKVNLGIGVATETDVENNNTFGFSASITGSRSGSSTSITTNTQSWSTSSNSVSPGKNSDLFIGKSKNVTFGISDNLKFVPDSLCNVYECLTGPSSNSFGDWELAETHALSVVPGGYNTQFIYSEDHIKNQLIPDLIELRNTILESNPKYSNVLPNSDPNYGLNNDDPRVNNNIPLLTQAQQIAYKLQIPDSLVTISYTIGGQTTTVDVLVYSNTLMQLWFGLKQIENPGFEVLSGNSYTYNAINRQDSLTGDSVRWVNNQIKLWEDAVMLNEWEKLNINNNQLREIFKKRELGNLLDEYLPDLIGYGILTATTGVSGIASLPSILAPYPGAAIASGITFSITTGAGIGAAELQQRVNEYEIQKDRIIEYYNLDTPQVYSISSGAITTSSISHESASTISNSLEYGMSASLELEVSTKVSNNGIGFKKSIGMNFSSGRDWGTSTSNSEMVSFTLQDDDPGDYYAVDVYQSLLGWGPIFKKKAGGKSACPFEGAAETEYYYPGTPIDEATAQIEKPEIQVIGSNILTNIPVASPAAFTLNLINNSESNDAVTYDVEVVSASNPFGAICKIDGVSPFTSVTIPGGSSINKIITINKGPGGTYDYDSILVIIHSQCQYSAGTDPDPDIVDSVYISAHFIPTCSDLNLYRPLDLWVLNNYNNDSLEIVIDNYDVNFYGFEGFGIDYKPSNQSQWINLQNFYKDTATITNDPTKLPIPTNLPKTKWFWETDNFPDGGYDLRAVSYCELADLESTLHTGLMDRINPSPFGTPSPSDGILDPGDDILIRFNEPIDLGSLTPFNFDVRGVKNGTTTTHASNLYFDGVNDYVEITAGAPLQNRDFTLEFSVKRESNGAQTVLSQGTDGGDHISVGFDANDKLVFTINNQSITSNTSFTNDGFWHTFAVSYNKATETADMYEVSELSTASVINIGNNTIYPKYLGNSRLIIGKNDVGNADHFNGNIDDVRIWNTSRSLSEFSLNSQKLMSGNQPGLLYNWLFDEADGNIVEDHVRSRNGIIYGAEWTVEPSGYAATFDGVNQYVTVGKGNVNITDNMDFTLEFWFNSTQSGVATLLSTGLADGISSDSLTAWNIYKDAQGSIHVLHDGMDWIAVDSSYFDGNWHHFALVLNRIGNLTSYLDGNLIKSTQAVPYKQLGGAKFYVGARGYYLGSTENIDQYFEGQIDEFRFWNASRKFEQVKRDKQNRMLGDETALQIYLPFESYEVDPSGAILLNATFTEQIDSSTHLVSNFNNVGTNNNTPKIKIPRPIEHIPFTWSVNNDEIIITPTASPESIENITLDITVENVLDLHGNKMESPATWIAYVDKNQVFWQDDYYYAEKTYGTPLSFVRAIVNEGGATKDFTIQNIPSWLSVSPTSGSIAPNSQMNIQFTVDQYINIGDYLNDIQLLTDFGYPERLTVELKVRDEEPNWAVDPADFENSMSIVGYLKIDNVVSTDDEDMLGAFVNGESRGAAHLQYIPQTDRYLVFLDVYSNVNAGENITFQIWDASSGTVFSSVLPASIPFESNTIIGTLANPQLFESDKEITFKVPVQTGWNWVANFLYNTDSMDLDVTLNSLESVTGDEIKSQDHFSNYLSNTGWVGALNEDGIVPEEGYRIKVAQNDTIEWQGDIINPITRTITLETGWNWIGFISIRNQSVNDALGNLTPADGDLIKGKTNFAIYDSIIGGWIGSLQTMIPGRSYMYKSANNNQFVYPYAGMFKSGNIANETALPAIPWSYNGNQFGGNMTQIASLTNCDYINQTDSLILSVNDAFDNSRGAGYIMNNGSNGNLNYVTLSGDVSEKLNYMIYNPHTTMSYNLGNSINFENNKHVGSLRNPYTIEVSEDVCKKMANDAELVVVDNGMAVYPTEFSNVINIDYILQQEFADANVELYNVWGQSVLSTSNQFVKGNNHYLLKTDGLELAPGMYVLTISHDDVVKTFKLIHK